MTTWSPRLASQPRLCWVVCLRCNGVPLGLQEERPRHFWVSPFATSSACLLRQAGGSPTWAKAPPPAAGPLRWGGIRPFSTHLLGIFVHLIPGIQGVPAGLFGHSLFHPGSS